MLENTPIILMIFFIGKVVINERYFFQVSDISLPVGGALPREAGEAQGRLARRARLRVPRVARHARRHRGVGRTGALMSNFRKY